MCVKQLQGGLSHGSMQAHDMRLAAGVDEHRLAAAVLASRKAVCTARAGKQCQVRRPLHHAMPQQAAGQEGCSVVSLAGGAASLSNV